MTLSMNRQSPFSTMVESSPPVKCVRFSSVVHYNNGDFGILPGPENVSTDSSNTRWRASAEHDDHVLASPRLRSRPASDHSPTIPKRKVSSECYTKKQAQELGAVKLAHDDDNEVPATPLQSPIPLSLESVRLSDSDQWFMRQLDTPTKRVKRKFRMSWNKISDPPLLSQSEWTTVSPVQVRRSSTE